MICIYVSRRKVDAVSIEIDNVKVEEVRYKV